MARNFRLAACLLTATSSLVIPGTGAWAQDDPPSSDSASDLFEQDEVEEIVVTGARERGSVRGNVAPEAQLRPADIRALGVSDISELLTELGPELQSVSGRPPVTLLEGHRIASFREIARIPAEAIARIDILPEEAGLRYGYGADQKVMNVVLRQRFQAFDGEIDGRFPAAGAGASLEVEGGFLLIRNGQRININAEYNDSSAVMETDRGLDRPESVARTLRPAQQDLTVGATYSRPLDERTKATLSGEIVTARRESKVGLALPAVTIPGGTPYADGAEDVAFYPLGPGENVLGRSSSSQTGELGVTVNAERGPGQWTLTGTYRREESRGITSRPFNLTDYAAAIAAGDAIADPSLPIAPIFLIGRPSDQTRSYTDTGNVDLIYNRPLFSLPAGDVAMTAKLNGAMLRLENDQERDFIVTSRNLSRNNGGGSLNLDFPVSSSSSPLGRLSANANAGAEHFSDAGTVRSFGGGLNWNPLRAVSFSASYSDEESVATPQQLGDPRTVTQFVPVFDFVRGESVLVTTITGGNPLLDNAQAQNFRVGVRFSLLQEPSLRLNVDYSRQKTRGGIAQFPGITQESAAAFPDRFQRDDSGRLTLVDLRPINMTEQKRQVLRWGLNFSKRLRTPRSQIDAMRGSFQRRMAQGGPRSGSGDQGQDSPSPGDATMAGEGQRPPQRAAPDGGRDGGGPRMRGAGGRGGGGGRLNFSLHHEWALANTTQLAPTLPVLDLLAGDALGDGGGPSRHSVEFRGGLSQGAYGLRVSGEWKSATRVNGIAGTPSSQLHFSNLATIDLRAFVNFSQMPRLIEKMPVLRGARLQIGVDNVFDARQRVTDGNGNVPFAYQSAFLDPLGRTVRISIRKLFM